ncbi:UbiA prenyltransferase family protein [Portibacter lacus]|uniref:Prenyltransferase n=1 Tax=Portibacter lacus TaxID=1099794 RepID=A0AA37SWL6_9BACT|nr:hypothetical protein [Portibacter lacus]GLR20046.1 hypothetical protein GCM10007940_46620 [Portibacter lacus]
MKFVKKLIDFYLYSSIHIAVGAALSIILCYAVLVHIPTSDYPIFVFAATLFLYCSHRIIGIKTVEKFEHEGRYAVIKKYKVHIILYAILGGIGSVILYFYLPFIMKLWLIAPAIVSLFYVLPIFSNHKRLRDIGLIKIFLISIIWALIIGVIPYVEAKGTLDGLGILFALEKAIFIFAITLPFDARDLIVDDANAVKTIPATIGIDNAYKAAYFLMAAVMIIVVSLYALGLYSGGVTIALIIGYLITSLAIKLSKGKKDDYYYSGVLDGTIAFVAILGIAVSGILDVIF